MCESCRETQVRLQEMNEKLDQLHKIVPIFQKDLKKLKKESMEMTSSLSVLNNEAEELRKLKTILKQTLIRNINIQGKDNSKFQKLHINFRGKM